MFLLFKKSTFGYFSTKFPFFLIFKFFGRTA